MDAISSGASLGATITGLDLSEPLNDATFGALLRHLAEFGVLCIPHQMLTPASQKAFTGMFGELEIHVAQLFQDPNHPEVMILSNIIENGEPIGLADAGQDWHTDMSFSSTIAFVNVLYGIKIPHRDGRALGATQFADMAAAYDDLPTDVKRHIAPLTALHDFNKFWDMMCAKEGSTRRPLSPEQRRRKPPVSHPVVMTHPLSGRKILYANPGYTVRINELPPEESDELLASLFAHQLQPIYQYAHHWSEHDVLIWDDIRTLHTAAADYLPSEHRLIKRCQAMADRIFDPSFARLASVMTA